MKCLLLPDLPDTVHGIKCREPFIVQCDNCFALFHSHIDILTARSVIFNQRAVKHKGKRYCHQCWADFGYYSQGLSPIVDDPQSAQKALESGYSTHRDYEISYERALELMGGAS